MSDLFGAAIGAGDVEVIGHAVVRLGDQAFQGLVDQEQNVLRPRALDRHRQLNVTKTDTDADTLM